MNAAERFLAASRFHDLCPSQPATGLPLAAPGARPRTLEELAADLDALAVRDGDLVMVHVSMRAVGPVAGGAAGLVAALDAAVGPTGTVVVNVGARDDFDWVNGRDPSERAALLTAAPPFNAANTPADPDVGVFAEVFRSTTATVVNDHPDARFAARGRRAAEVLEPVPWNDYYGPGSPLERLVDGGGRLLRLGADIDTVTALHLAEYRADLPAKRRALRHHRVRSEAGGSEIRSVSCLDDSDGIVDLPGADYFGLVTTAYLDTGRASTGTVGGARAELLDAADMVAFAQAWMEEHLRPPDDLGRRV